MNADMWHAVLALALLGLTVWLPGFTLSRLLSPAGSKLAAIAVAPAVGAGVLYCAGEVLTAIDLPVDTRLPLVLTTISIAALLWRERQRLHEWRGVRPPAAVVGGSLIATLIWALGIRHLKAVPPHNDGLNHGFFVARIARFHTLKPSIVMPHDVLSGGHGVSYYPLALHQQAAVLVDVLHLDVALAWTLTSLSLAVLALPMGMYALCNRLFPLHRRAASAAAIVSALMPGVTYSTSWWGGFTLAAGLSVSAGAFLCVMAAIEAPLSPSRVLLAGIALAGVAGIHTSEFSFLVVTCGVVVLVESYQRRNLKEFVRSSIRLSFCVLVALVLLAPVWGQMVSGLDERTYPVTDYGLSLAKSIGEVVVVYSFVPPATPAAIVLSVWLGIALAQRHAAARGWVGAWLAFAFLFIWLAAYPDRIIYAVTSTWYSDRFRIGYLLAFLAIPFVGLAVAGPDTRATSPTRRSWAALATALAVVLGVTSFVGSVDGVRQNYRNYSLVGSDARAAFQFLAAHVRPGERVLNQHQDGSPWMYALSGVAPAVALKTFGYERPEWADVNYLLRHISSAGRDHRVDTLLVEFNIRYVYVGARTIPTERPDIDRVALSRSPAFRVVFQRHGTRVYELLAQSLASS